MISGHFGDSWKNNFDKLDRLSSEVASPIFWGVESSDKVFQLPLDASNLSPLSGIGRLDQSLITPAVSRLMTNAGDSLRGQSRNTERFTLENVSARQHQSSELVKAISRLSTPSLSQRERADLSIIRRVASTILSAFASAESGRVWPEGADFLTAFEEERWTEVSEAITEKAILESCKDSRFKSLVEKALAPLLAVIARENPESTDFPSAWVYVGLLNLHLSLPSTPLDPASKPAAKAASFLSRLTELGVRGEIKVWSELIANGGESSEFQPEGWEGLKSKLTRQQKKVVTRLEVPGSTFKGFYYEAWSYARSLGNIDAALSALGDSKKEENWQEATAEFLERLSDGYEGYEDVKTGIEVGIGCIRKGLRLNAARAYEQHRDVGVKEATKILLEYPYRYTSDWDVHLGEIINEKGCMRNLSTQVSKHMKAHGNVGSIKKQVLGVQVSGWQERAPLGSVATTVYYYSTITNNLPLVALLIADECPLCRVVSFVVDGSRKQIVAFGGDRVFRKQCECLENG